MAIGTPVDLGHAAAGAGATTITMTTTAAVSAGDAVFVVYGTTLTGTNSQPTVGDGTANVYVAGFERTAGPSLGLLYCANALAVSSSSTITVTWGASATNRVVSAFKVSGMNTTPGLIRDVRAGPTAGASATATSSSTLSTFALSSNSELVVAYWTTLSSSPGTITGPSGFTLVGGSTATVWLQPYYKIVTDGSITSASLSWVNSVSYALAMSAFLGAQATNTSRQAQGTLTGVGA